MPLAAIERHPAGRLLRPVARRNPEPEASERCHNPELEGSDSEREILAVLRTTHRLLLDDGWCARDWDLPEEKRIGFSLTRAVVTAGQGTLPGWKARLLLQKAAGDNNLPGWEQHPLRTRTEVFEALYKAIELAGGRKPRRGGYVISSGARRR